MSTSIQDVLNVARARGFLGPGDVAFHVEHAKRYASLLDQEDRAILDLGSGAGVPGLVVADQLRSARVVLLDAGTRRCELLEEAVGLLGLSGRVDVVRARAEVAGRDPQWRGRFDVVVTRGFGPPATTAECGAPFLRIGGRLIVSEPREDQGRWPDEGVAVVGLRRGALVDDGVARLRVLEQRDACPEDFPRGDGVPKKRPLF